MNAPVRVHTDTRLVEHFEASPLRLVIDQVASLPTVESVDVFADIAPKQLGIPSGVVLTTSGHDPMLYPTAVTDIACGFAVIATGIDPSQWGHATRRQVFDDMCAAVAVTSPTRTPPAIDIEAVLATGLKALSAPRSYSYGPGADQTDDLVGDPALFDSHMLRTLAEHAGSVAGHFIALYTAEPLSGARTNLHHGELVLAVHTGAPAIRAWAYQHLFTPIAERCLALRLVEPRLVGTHQLFGLPLSDTLSQAFLRMAATAVLYGYATRHLAAETILDVFDRRRPARVAEPRLVRHNGHGWYEYGPHRIRSGRGIQTINTQQHALIVGGDRTHAYLFLAGRHSNGLLSHGVPMWTHDAQRVAPMPLPDPRTLPANTLPSLSTWRDAAINLELVRSSLETTGHATPVVRLMPWANYKETHVDAVIRPRS